MRYLLFALILFTLLVAPCRADQTVLLVTNEYMPYVRTQEKSPGFLTEVVVAAFREAGVTAQIEYKPWRRCAMLVEDGNALATYPYGKTPKRAKYALFSDPIWECRNVFFYLKGRLGDFDYTNLEALRRYVIAGTSGNYYEETFGDVGLTVDYAPGEASGIRKVWEMRSDLFAEDELVGWTMISRIFPAYKHMFGSTPTPWNVNPQHLMVSKRYPGAQKMLDKFNRGLRAIRENGEYDRILCRYLKK